MFGLVDITAGLGTCLVGSLFGSLLCGLSDILNSFFIARPAVAELLTDIPTRAVDNRQALPRVRKHTIDGFLEKLQLCDRQITGRAAASNGRQALHGFAVMRAYRIQLVLGELFHALVDCLVRTGQGFGIALS